MKRSERINDMLLFLNDKKFFNLKDLMERYNISKSTAIRDVQSLEEIGMPIYSDLGRNGKYGILNNRILSPIVFTVDEMYALYFSLLTLNGYRTRPFDVEFQALELKYRNVLPDHMKEQLAILKQVLSFEVTNHSNFSPYLKEVLQGIMEQKVYEVQYSEKVMPVQFIAINAKFGQWYARVWNYSSERIQVIRCDKISTLKASADFQPIALEKLLIMSDDYHREEASIPFTVTVCKKGKDTYDKEHYPSMKIAEQGDQYVIEGYYNSDELPFITHYFMQYGTTILHIQPPDLREAIIQHSLTLVEHFRDL